MSALLRCEGLTVAFGGLRALDELSFAVGAGSIVGLIGPNGSGKTTFFNAVTGLCRARAGRIVFDGRDITRLAPPDIYRQGITRTFQRSRLCLPLSVFDNVAMGNQRTFSLGLVSNLVFRSRFRQELDDTVARARRLLGYFSRGLADRMFEPAGSFNMIDRRRIEICRALIAAPRLILLDEPSAGMTLDETRELMDDILRVRQERPEMSVIIIEHEMEVIRRVAEHCVVLNYGRKVAEGGYDDVVADPWVQQAYLGVA